MYRILLVAALLVCAAYVPAIAQTDSPTDAKSQSAAYTSTSDLSDVHLFQSWVADAVFTPGVDLEPFYEWNDWPDGNTWNLGTRVALWVGEGMEAGGRITWSGMSADGGGDDNGFGDLDLHFRYRLPVEFPGTVATGAELRVPSGDPSTGQDNTFVRIFGAVRQDVGGAFTFTANLGFEYIELFGVDGNGLALGLGSIVPLTDALATVFELNLRTAIDYAVVSGGVDYELPLGAHLRSAIALGLDDMAPDVGLQFALSIPIY